MSTGVNKIALTRMKDGQGGTVVEIAGGFAVTERLAAMGIHPGKRISKFCSMFFRGPVTICIDNTQVALGRGIADKIFVEPDVVADESCSCR
ncbi:MAG: FeoA family protein [Dehalococcoidia bacterium]|nr:FeoA family protein [Dehalococcoidia bacterium]MDD5493528.1 FeoA family protein [Dehalococcoidia bacterium]